MSAHEKLIEFFCVCGLKILKPLRSEFQIPITDLCLVKENASPPAGQSLLLCLVYFPLFKNFRVFCLSHALRCSCLPQVSE